MTTSTLFRFDTSQMPAQRRFMESTAGSLLYSGAFGAGKSRVLCEKALYLSLKYPGNKGAIFRKTFASLKKTTMDTLWSYVLPEELIKSYNKVDQELILVNGSKIHFMGIDQPTRVGSLELGWAAIDEGIELTDEDYTMIDGRLRLNTVPFRQMMVATNPGAPTHYLYRHFYEEGHGEYFESNTLANIFNPPDYLERLSGILGRYYDRYVLGQWVGFEGLVYDNWNPAEGIITPFDIPADWKIYRAIDFGYTNPFVCQWWAEAPKNEDLEVTDYDGHTFKPHGYYLFREIYMSQRLVETHGDDIIRFGGRVAVTISDHDSGDRAVLEQRGVPTIPANKEIEQGLQSVYNAINNNRIHIFKNCLVDVDPSLSGSSKPYSTVQEFPTYIWQPATLIRNEKEVPRDKDNHGMDALRYLVHSLEKGPASSQHVVFKRGPSRIPEVMTRDWGGGTSRNWFEV